jgi:hypothetical protein
VGATFSDELSEDELREAVALLGMERLKEEWNNSLDAIYDNWRHLYPNLANNQQPSTNNSNLSREDKLSCQ